MIVILIFTSACSISGEFNSAVENAIKNYKLTEQYGDSVDACIAAGVVKLEYQEIRDLENYKKWKKVQNQKCSWVGY